VTGPIEALEDKVQYRVIAEYVNRDQPGYEDAFDEHYTLSLKFGFDLGKTARMTIGYAYMDRALVNDRGVIDPSTGTEGTVDSPGNAGVPLRGFTTAMAFNDTIGIVRTQTKILDVVYTSTPFPGFSYRAVFSWESYQQAGNFFSGPGGSIPEDGVYSPVAFALNDSDFEVLNGALDMTWNYKHKGGDSFKNRLTLGTDLSYQNGTFTRALGRPPQTPLLPIDTNNLSTYLNQPEPVVNWADTGESDELIGGFYVQDRLSFWQDKLQFNGGVRYNFIGGSRLFIPTPTGRKGVFLEDENGDVILNFPFNDFQRHFLKTTYVSTPYGFVVKPIEQLSFFYGFSDAFRSNGTNTLIFGGGRVPAEISEGREFGAKFDFLRGLSGTISFFDIDVTNRVTDDPDNLGFKIVRPPLNNTGWEMSLTYLWKDLTLLAGYYDGDLKEKASGLRPDREPNETFSLFGRYQVSKGSLAGLTIGGGYNWVGSYPVNGRTEIVSSYETFDIFLGYQRGDWRFQVNGKNIFDENYTVRYIRPGLVLVGNGDYWQFSVTRFFGGGGKL